MHLDVRRRPYATLGNRMEESRPGTVAILFVNYQAGGFHAERMQHVCTSATRTLRNPCFAKITSFPNTLRFWIPQRQPSRHGL